jgi:hypothetical protein
MSLINKNKYHTILCVWFLFAFVKERGVFPSEISKNLSVLWEILKTI